jgi:Transposase DDE domain
MMIAPRLPHGKGLFGKFNWKSFLGRHLLNMMLAILHHHGRMSAQQAASAVVGESRHRGNVGRFLKRHVQELAWTGHQCAKRLLNTAQPRGRYVFIVDSTSVGHQGERTPNTFSTGNRSRRPAKRRRYNKYQHATRGCHLFVWGLLITPDGRRIPSFCSYYTREYCAQQGWPHRTQADLAAELVRSLTVPSSAQVVVLGDTAFESRQMRCACQQRGFTWIMPANPERVLGGEKPRPRLWSLTERFRNRMFVPVRLSLDQGPYVAMRRQSSCKRGSKKTARTFYVHEERCSVHSVGDVRIVFSTKHKPQSGKPLERNQTKVLLCSDPQLKMAEIVELYLLRWQIELFFKELKSNLGMHQYRQRDVDSIQAWMEIYRITFLYLEWVRAHHIRSSKGRHRQWWHGQRTHGLTLAVCERLAEAQLLTIHRCTETASGLRRLRKLLRKALPSEYRNAA